MKTRLKESTIMSRTLLAVLCSALLCTTPAWADVYTWTDANGNTVYSDKPNPNAKRIEVSTPNSMDAPKPIPAYQSSSASSSSAGSGNSVTPTGSYRRLEITSPANDTAVRANDGNVTLTVVLNPPLRAGHLLRARIDGSLSEQALPGAGQAEANLTVTNLDRGSHLVEAVVTNSKGEQISASTGITLHVQRTSLNQPGRVGAANQAPTAPAAPTAPNVPRPPATTP
ncbi:DUF4124 domain-containing protein [Halopseudomonas maritima]|uniref:DUF4124 domain-containing protein n=1 Tax=Halopseudomonas maritima TaxID=2918528 RepID=UPI001EEBF879|nr:DUF4124 domain-containing protein [Halopseudomonas maritima]UJJ30099.1 DUF4124 domain-containing protein [Halopseudomonas maritima]